MIAITLSDGCLDVALNHSLCSVRIFEISAIPMGVPKVRCSATKKRSFWNRTSCFKGQFGNFQPSCSVAATTASVWTGRAPGTATRWAWGDRRMGGSTAGATATGS